MVPWVHRLLE
jgi:hypothetical protein